MVASVAGELEGGQDRRTPPVPHPAPFGLDGGARRRRAQGARRARSALAHLGVLLLDELPEFRRGVPDSLRQPLETGTVSVARANAHATVPRGSSWSAR